MDSFIHQKFEFLLGTCHSLGPGKGAENRPVTFLPPGNFYILEETARNK